MNVNDRLALELGRAQIGRFVAEAQLDAAKASIRTLEEKVAELSTEDETLPTPDTSSG